MADKCIVFDIWGTYGHFRKPYSTNSSLTYFFPSKPTIIGILASIVGREKNSYSELIEKIKVSIVIKERGNLRKQIFTINYENTKIKKFENSQVNVELLLNPSYTIYVLIEDNISDQNYHDFCNDLEKKLTTHESIYTISLGSAFCLANFKLQRILEVRSKVSESEIVHSVIPKNDSSRVMLSQNSHIIIEKMPHLLDGNRRPIRFLDFYACIKGEDLKVKNTKFHQVGEQNVIFF